MQREKNDVKINRPTVTKKVVLCVQSYLVIHSHLVNEKLAKKNISLFFIAANLNL